MSKKPTKPQEALFDYAGKGDASNLTRLLANGVPADVRDRYGATPLMEAARLGHQDCVERLVGGGADVNAVDKEESSALMVACGGDSLANDDIVNFLLARGAIVDQRDVFGCTALMRAAAKGDARIVRALIRSGSDVNAVSHNDETPLTWAIVWDHLEIVKALIEAGANVNWVPRKGSWAPLNYAVFEKKAKIARLLEEHGASVSESLHVNGQPTAKKPAKLNGGPRRKKRVIQRSQPK